MQRTSLATESIESSLSSETPCATLSDQLDIKSLQSSKSSSRRVSWNSTEKIAVILAELTGSTARKQAERACQVAVRLSFLLTSGIRAPGLDTSSRSKRFSNIDTVFGSCAG